MHCVNLICYMPDFVSLALPLVQFLEGNRHSCPSLPSKFLVHPKESHVPNRQVGQS